MFNKFFFRALLVIVTIGFHGIGLTDNYTPRVGEYLEYEVIVKSFLYGANQTVRVQKTGAYQDRPVIKVQYSMDSVGLVKSLTKYKEKEEALLDCEGLYPWVIRREVSDKNGTETETATFDYARGLAIREYSKNGGPKERTVIMVPGYVQDALSLQFFLRKKFSKGQQIFFYADGEIKEISYQAIKKEEPLEMKCGIFQRYYQVSNEEEKVAILIAEGPENYPVVIRKIGKIGKIEARLIKIK